MLNVTDIAIALILVVLGCLLTYVSSRRALQAAVADLQRETERRLDDLQSLVKTLETRVAELKTAAVPVAQAAVPAPTAKSQSASLPPERATAPVAKAEKQEEVAPEMLLVIAAAVTAYLGKKVRIRSAKMLQSPYEIGNPWLQQGRVFVQASHNLRPRG